VADPPGEARREAWVMQERVDGSYYVVDLGNTNGTFVNGVDIRGRGLYPLRRGDVINVAGVVELVVE